MKLAMAQMSMTGSMDENLKRSLAFCDAAAGSDLLFFPEVQLTPFFPQYAGRNVDAYVVPAGSPTVPSPCAEPQDHAGSAVSTRTARAVSIPSATASRSVAGHNLIAAPRSAFTRAGEASFLGEPTSALPDPSAASHVRCSVAGRPSGSSTRATRAGNSPTSRPPSLVSK